MCGLICVVSKQKNGLFGLDTKIFTELLFANQLRGADGTGIFYNKSNKEIKALKSSSPSSQFITDKLYEKAVKEVMQSGNFIVGHNRAATKGQVNFENTHPFREGHITLVHNGTLSNHKNLADTENDSHAIAKSFVTVGAKETIKKINGAFALIWADAKQKTLNIVRNSQRPLWLVSTKNLFVFVSEKELAHWICERNHEQVIKTQEVPVNTLFQFEFGVWDKYETQKVDVYTPPPFAYNQPQTTHISRRGGGGGVLGSYIKFTATRLDEELGLKLIGEYKAPDGKIYEINFWCGSRNHGESLLKQKVLVGKIIQEVYSSITKKRKYIVANVSPYSGGTITTANGLILTSEEVKAIDNRCEYCNGTFSKELLHTCDVVKRENDKYTVTCPVCTAWFKREGML